MGMQLGPGFLRRPPGGWVPGRASAVAHRVCEWGSSGPDGGQSDIDTACGLDARWRVELPGREPYEFDEEGRTAPTWVLGGGRSGRAPLVQGPGRADLRADGRRRVPVLRRPAEPGRVWIDWDAAYEAHTEAWGRHARVEREVARRENLWEYPSSA